MQKYKIVRYGQWWYGILNTETDIMLRVGPNPNYNGPLDDKENKLLLFKNKEKAQEYIDNNLTSTIRESIQSNTIKPIFGKWDDKRKCIIVSKEEYDRWDD